MLDLVGLILTNKRVKVVIIFFLVFLFALILRLWNFNEMGRWADEEWYVVKGYTFINLIIKGDFGNSIWYMAGGDHPPLTSYFYGLASFKDLIGFDPNTIPFNGWIKGYPTFNYDLTWSRMVSSVVASLSVALVFIMGARYFSLFVGIVSSMILAMIPHFLGLSQFVVLETWIMLSFTAAAFSYFLFLEKRTTLLLIITGVLAGITIMVKESNVLIFILFLLTYFVFRYKTQGKRLGFIHLIYIGIISLFVSFVIYPFPFLNLNEYLIHIYHLWFEGKDLIPELLFGMPMGARFPFYFIAFAVTTPVIIIFLFATGLVESIKRRKNWIYTALIIWLLVPFLLSFFHNRQHMVRHIIQFYAPLSLLSAIGLEYIIRRFFNKRYIYYIAGILLFLYMFVILFRITPYYLNYFNEYVGGARNVFENQLFFQGWFGEGLKNPGIFLSDYAKRDSIIGMALDPSEDTLYKSPDLIYESYDPKLKYDYVIVNHFNVVRNNFDISTLEKNYRLIYVENVDGVDLAYVFEKIN